MKLSKEFTTWLEEYDSALTAWYDSQQDAVHIYSVRQGMKTLEYTGKRQYAETYPELLRRIQKVLPTKDVWKRFGSANAYDDHLMQKEQEHSRKIREEAKAARLAKFKDEQSLWLSAIENMQAGRFTKQEVEKFHGRKVTEVDKPKEA